MAVVVVNAPRKTVSSRAGMEHTQLTSHYYRQWARVARRHFRELVTAVRIDDLAHAGELMEANALAMHACMLAASPPLLYWAPATVALLQAARAWRASGLAVYATVDAGPHPALLTRREELGRVASRARRVPGVRRVIASLPGEPARIIDVQ